MKNDLKLIIPGVPPSTNTLYVNRHGKRTLSAAGKKYKHQVGTQIAQQFPTLEAYKNEDAFLLKIQIETAILTKTKGAKNRYKKWDVSNRIKVLEDALCAAVGIDDSQIITLEIQKWQREGPERTVVTLKKLPSDTAQLSSGSSASKRGTE